ncbi:Pentatricopeptide repeat-containing protein [Acorus gramineus]|uniref:Pentatricopeptide repeat-containing protein n=1 Tax=Acorus gramineus TaxID=55184 RepID=A0AAV9ANT6_ACOGR|nr:Pentatricopeptide repeat-containing protein [Acorus gramineus]
MTCNSASALPLNPTIPPTNLRKSTTTTTTTTNSSPQNPLSLLPRCTSLRHLQQIHASLLKTHQHLQTHLSIMSKLIHFCSSNPTPNHMSYAHSLFDQTPHPDSTLFNTLSRGYSRSPHPIHSVLLFVRMLSSGVPPDDYTFPSLLKACAASKALSEGTQAHSLAVKLRLHRNPFVLPTLITMYAECGDLTSARALFDSTPKTCVISYNAMIAAYARASCPNEALALFRELQSAGLEPTYVTMLGVLSSCALLGALELGRWAHEFVSNRGFDAYVKVGTALVDMYAKCGSLADAERVFRGMARGDTQAWSAMIMAYAIHGHGSVAVSLFEEMKEHHGLRPDDITFLGVLYACSHAGMVEEGLAYFDSMRDAYKIVPSVKHYGCVVDLLARAGRLEEAYSFVDGLPIDPTPILWRTLLSACGVHGNADMGMRVMERIFESGDDTHSGDYVILSNTLAAQNRWDDVMRVRRLMSEKGVVKVPGCSAIEVENVMHEFFSGDGTHPRSREVHRMVDELVEELKSVGYVPDTSVVYHMEMGEMEKEMSLRYHSEKLAIAFGVLNTPPGTTIRVVKNLRVCRDCHAAAKLMSMQLEREIVLRDLNRFHHFKDGKCSCGDYW